MKNARKTEATADQARKSCWVTRACGRSLLAVCLILGLQGQAHSASQTGASGSGTRPRLVTETVGLPLIDGRDIRFRPIPAVNGLSQTRAGSTVQDRLGFIWFGTQYGLNRFDGYRFKVFRHEPKHPESLGGVYVRSLFIDHSGTLWVGCDESFDKFDPVTETFTHFRVGPPGTDENDGPAIHVSEDRYGKLWLATAKGLFGFDPSQRTHDPVYP